jgi:CheY-like chemotaxis protein
MGAEILVEEGHHVVTVGDGEAALKYLSENRPDIVLADLHMPGASGLDVCRCIRSDPRLAATRVLLLRGPLEPFSRQEADEARSDGVLTKPLDAAVLVSTVKRLLEVNPGSKSKANDPAPLPLASVAAENHGPPAQPPESPAAPVAADLKAGGNPSPSAGPSRDEILVEVIARILDPKISVPPTPERVRAAVEAALQTAAPALIERITEQVVRELKDVPRQNGEGVLNHGSE